MVSQYAVRIVMSEMEDWKLSRLVMELFEEVGKAFQRRIVLGKNEYR